MIESIAVIVATAILGRQPLRHAWQAYCDWLEMKGCIKGALVASAAWLGVYLVSSLFRRVGK